MRGNLEEVKKIIDKADNKDGKSRERMLSVVERRNYEGKTPLLISIEHGRNEISFYLLEQYGSEIDLEKSDSRDGNSCLHVAC
jgi:ankyrin repeat protein